MKKSLAVPLCLALAAASFAVAGTATALEHPSHRPLLSVGGDSGPSGLLVRKAVGGRAAITELGSNLDEVAAASGMSTARLTRILTTDPTARIFPAGRLAYVDPARPSSVSAEPPVAQAQFPDSQTFTLHSRPGSDHVIYLDFNGATVSGTAWNTGADAVPNAFYDGFTLDGDTSTYTPTEHTYMQEVWRMVAETYKTFDVDVTTADPGVAAYNRTDANDPTYGDHVLITDDPDSYPACDPTGGCAGVAFVGTFDNAGEPTDKYEPEWVHPSQYAFDTATTISHEVGHTLGLSHDGVTGGSAYYAGQGNWSPIMGSGPNAVQQFSIGDYANANNTEDDLAVISAHGLPRIADEAGDTLAAALDLGAQTSYARTGLISTRTDADYYKISHPCSTDLTVSASGSGVGSALDLRWDLYDASGNQLDFSDPVSSQSNDVLPVATGMDAPAKTHAAPVGTYYVKVDGVGKGNPLTTGYSDYGSVGSYALSVSGCSGATGTAPNAPTNVAMPTTKGVGTVTWTAPTVVGSSPITGYVINGLPGSPITVPAGTTSKVVTVVGGSDVTVSVAAVNASGPGPGGTVTRHVNSWAPTAAPAVHVTVSGLTATVSWTPAANPGNAALTGWRLTLDGTIEPDLPPGTTSIPVTASAYGSYPASLKPLMTVEDGSVPPTASFTIVIAKAPTAPRIGTASSGARGGSVTATARWSAPASNGGATITSYKVIASKLNTRGQVTRTLTSSARPASARSYAWRLPRGSYKFRVVAYNVRGASPASGYSRKVSAR